MVNLDAHVLNLKIHTEADEFLVTICYSVRVWLEIWQLTLKTKFFFLSYLVFQMT